MKHVLTMHLGGITITDIREQGEVRYYQVRGLPENHRALIERGPADWGIKRSTAPGEHMSVWGARHAKPEDALAELQTDYDNQ